MNYESRIMNHADEAVAIIHTSYSMILNYEGAKR